MVVIPERQVRYQQYQSFGGTNEHLYGQQPAQYYGNYAHHQHPTSQHALHHINREDHYQPQNQEQYQILPHVGHQGQYHEQSSPQHPQQPSLQRVHQKSPKHQHQYQPHPIKPHQSFTSIHQNSKPSLKNLEKQSVSLTNPKTEAVETSSTHCGTPFDYQLLLLSMADEYISAAHNMACKVAHAQDSKHAEEYYQLMATGLGCMDSVLKNFKLHPREEAKLRLRYATLLHEELVNPEETEKVLSKGIQLSEKHRLFDLKYGMQHLLARTLFETRQKAALKFLDKIIADVEAYHHTAWIYAFRFLRVTLSLQTFSHSEALACIQHLKAICDLARGSDRAIFVTSATMQAMVHLRLSASDSVEQAQQAIAAARSEQLDPTLQHLPQITSLLSFQDLGCVLQLHNEPDQITAKMNAMNNIMDESRPDLKWTADGSFGVPLGKHSENQTTQDTGGIFQGLSDGGYALMFCSLPRDELYCAAFLLSSLAVFHRNAGGGKTDKFALEGLKVLKGNVQKTQRNLQANHFLDVLPHERIKSTSLPAASSLHRLRAHLDLNLRVYRIFGFCDLSNWTKAKEELDHLRRTLKDFSYQIPPHTQNLMLYLQGSIHQSAGNLDLALKVFRSSALALSQPPNRVPAPQQQLSILAALNTVLILRNPALDSYPEASEILNRLQSLCNDHPCKPIRAAYTLAQALVTSTDDEAHSGKPSMLTTKTSLSTSLGLAKSTQNAQIMALVLSFLTQIFFTGISGEQAEKSARAARATAHNWHSGLWIVVADGMLEQTLGLLGKEDERRKIKTDALEKLSNLPEGVRKKLEKVSP
ncbi:MAG: hypothetical protein Q9165_000070 [Trypethelium subeluteriae]